MEHRLREFLFRLGAHRTQHGKRTLFDHLKGVHDLLRDWDNEEHVCLAGLFHSIYGTDTFRPRLMSDRNELATMIGPHAETLVYLFSTADRPFFKNVEEKAIRKELLEIETANLLEQRANVEALRRLSWMAQISNGARAALNNGTI